MREVFKQGDDFYKGKDAHKEERKMLLDKWLESEMLIDQDPSISDEDKKGRWTDFVRNKMPKITKKQRRVRIEDTNPIEERGIYGERNQTEDPEEEAGWEEYIEYTFPDDPNSFKEPKLFRKAHEWDKKRQAG